MAMHNKPSAGLYEVCIWEYERGWGSRVDERLYFDTEPEARKYATDYNNRYNTEKEVPDWYMTAEYSGKVA